MRTVLLLGVLLAAGCVAPVQTADSGSGPTAGPDEGHDKSEAPTDFVLPGPGDPADWAHCDPASHTASPDVEVQYPGWPSFEEAMVLVQETLGTPPFEPARNWYEAGNVSIGDHGDQVRPEYGVGIAQQEGERAPGPWARDVAARLADAFYGPTVQGAWSENRSYSYDRSQRPYEKVWHPTYTLSQDSWYGAWPVPELVDVGVGKLGWIVTLRPPVVIEGAPGDPLTPDEVRQRAHAFWRCIEPEDDGFAYDELDAAMSLRWVFEHSVFGETHTYPHILVHWMRPDGAYITTPVLYMEPWTGKVVWHGRPPI